MKFVFHDGGRATAGYKGSASDCVTRAIAIATGKSYQEVYNALNRLSASDGMNKSKRWRSNSRIGIYRTTYRRYLEALGWRWTTMHAITPMWRTRFEAPMGEGFCSWPCPC
jgi:hypothetical protein